jgi:Tol biopolymer transport system component
MKKRPVLTALTTVLAAAMPVVALSMPAAAQSRGVANGEIAFSSPVKGHTQVFTVNPNGSGLRQVTHSSAQAGQYGLSWSPDGRGLVYSVTYSQGPDVIFKSLADGSGVTSISPSCTSTCLGDDNPSYSPDGKQVAFERAFGPIVNGNAAGVAIFSMNADGSGLTQLTPKKTATYSAYQQAHWSPDGTKIALVVYSQFTAPYTGGTYPSAIAVMNANGSNLRRLTAWRLDASNPSWSPDSKRLAFNTYSSPIVGESANIFTMRADGSDHVELTKYSGGYPQAWAGSWSPDGTQIVYRLFRFCSPGCSRIGGVYILNVRTGRVRRLTHMGVGTDSVAVWGRKPV